MHSAAPCALFPPLLLIRAQNLRKRILIFCFFPTLVGKCGYGAPQWPHPKFSSLFCILQDIREQGFWIPALFSTLCFSTLDFFSTLVGRCVYGAHRGPCTVSTRFASSKIFENRAFWFPLFFGPGFFLNSRWKVCVWRPPRPMHSFHWRRRSTRTAGLSRARRLRALCFQFAQTFMVGFISKYA